MPRISAEMTRIRARISALNAERLKLLQELDQLESLVPSENGNAIHPTVSGTASVTNHSPPNEKLQLFRQLFAGRPDVFPVRWESAKTGWAGYSPACSNEWVRGICGKPKIKCSDCPHQKFVPVDDDVIVRHLRGGDGRGSRFVAGVYPMLRDHTVWFLAIDFDKVCWADDARALLETCRAKSVPAALERSRSGNGGHVWIFFAEPVSARIARQLGSSLITLTMDQRPEIGFASYDRLFPSQDTLPLGGFGNLIALPLQREARRKGNSVFVDMDLHPYADQWANLSALPRLSAGAVTERVEAAERSGQILRVRLPVEEDNADEPWKSSASRHRKVRRSDLPMPPTVKVVFADQVYIDRTELPPPMITQLIRLAAFQNPEFYRAQAMRLPTFGKGIIYLSAIRQPKH